MILPQNHQLRVWLIQIQWAQHTARAREIIRGTLNGWVTCVRFTTAHSHWSKEMWRCSHWLNIAANLANNRSRLGNTPLFLTIRTERWVSAKREHPHPHTHTCFAFTFTKFHTFIEIEAFLLWPSWHCFKSSSSFSPACIYRAAPWEWGSEWCLWPPCRWEEEWRVHVGRGALGGNTHAVC